MNRPSFGWLISGVAVLGLSALTLWFGFAIMPARDKALAVGTTVPWYFTWGLIWLTALSGVVIAGNMFRIAVATDRSV